MLSYISADIIRHVYLNFPVATCLIGRTGLFIAANREYARLLGEPEGGVVGRHFRDLCGEALYQQVVRDFATVDAGGCVPNKEFGFGGRTFIVAIRPLTEPSRQRVFALCIVLTDITEQKTLEQRLELANEQLSAVNRQLEEAARIDPVTGLWNRRALEELLPREIARSRRDGTPLSVLMVDIDYFKKYNDHYGHLAGDIALRSVAQAMEEALHRPGDLIARYGGEEFLVVLPTTDAAAALQVADHLRSAVAARAIADATSHLGRVTISIGVASLNGVVPDADVETVRTALVHGADQALYAVKSEGRDGIRLHAEALPTP
ncbi:diguanylate cyclase [Ancylobacter sp. VNQ12]|uniref:sensor domain-containing diguanylate cyclase n=1 Tax=Ancylobacter sp. VNQ12 TaxID=3400920 RepID=UPI003C034383